MEIRLRRYGERDLPALAQLFYDTVHTVNAGDYDPQQLNAWAPGQIDAARWHETLEAHFSLVAEDGAGGLLGFADLDEAVGYLDRLYVHAAHQGKGVGAVLCTALETRACEAGCRAVTTHASVTARPFFEARGYRVLRAQQVERGGVTLPNFVMEKYL